jgi:hypothetical protein
MGWKRIDEWTIQDEATGQSEWAPSSDMAFPTGQPTNQDFLAGTGPQPEGLGDPADYARRSVETGINHEQGLPGPDPFWQDYALRAASAGIPQEQRLAEPYTGPALGDTPQFNQAQSHVTDDGGVVTPDGWRGSMADPNHLEALRALDMLSPPQNRPDYPADAPGTAPDDGPPRLGPVDPGAGQTPGAPDAGTPSSKLPGLGGDPRNTADAVAQENAAFANLGEMAKTAEGARFASEQDLATRAAAADAENVKGMEANEQTRVAEYKIHEAKRVAEETQFLNKMEQLAKTKVDPSRYWNDTSGFSKAAWIIGLAAGAMANPMDPSRNVALKMLSDAVDQDMEQQGESLQRQMGAMKERGQMLGAQHDREANELAQRAEGRFQRLQAIRAHVAALAKVPGAEQRVAGLAALDQELAKEQMGVVFKRGEHARRRDEAEIERKHQEREAMRQRAHAASQAKLARDAAIEAARVRRTQEVEDRNYDRETRERLAPVSVGGSQSVGATAANPLGGQTGVDFLVLPKESGFTFVDEATGKTEEIRLRKDDKASLETARAAGVLTAKFVNLVDALKDADTSSEYLGDDPKINAALEDALRPYMKIQDPDGKISDGDRNGAALAVAGMDFTSLKAKVLGPSRPAVLALVKSKLEATQRDNVVAIATARGLPIPKGTKIVFNMPDIALKPEADGPSAVEQDARLGVTANLPKPVTSAKDVQERLKRAKEQGISPDKVLPPMDPEVAKVLAEAQAMAAAQPHNTPAAYAAARKHLAKKLDTWAGAPKGSEATLAQAGHILDAYEATSQKEANAKFAAVIDIPYWSAVSLVEAERAVRENARQLGFGKNIPDEMYKTLARRAIAGIPARVGFK